MTEQEEYKRWLAEEATPVEAYMHRQMENAAHVWRMLANKRAAARRAANRPWGK